MVKTGRPCRSCDKAGHVRDSLGRKREKQRAERAAAEAVGKTLAEKQAAPQQQKPATHDELTRAAALLIEAGRLDVRSLPAVKAVPRYFRHIQHLGLSPTPTQFADADDFEDFEEGDLSEWDREQIALQLYGRDLQRQPWGVAMC